MAAPTAADKYEVLEKIGTSCSRWQPPSFPQLTLVRTWIIRAY